MARVKKQVVAGVTRDVMEAAFAEYAQADAKVQVITGKMDQEITKIREKYADQLASLNEIRDKKFEVIQIYAQENKDELFSKKRSIESTHGVFGFRTGTPKLKTLKGFTWGAALELAKEFLPGYVRTSEELAKDKLLADRDDEEVSKQLSRIGVTVAQDETFFIEPKKENEQALV